MAQAVSLAGAALAGAIMLGAAGCTAPATTASSGASRGGHLPCVASAPFSLGADLLERVYGLPAAPTGRAAGAGAVIAVVMPYLNPDARHDLAVYSRRFSLPVPRVQMIDWDDAPPASAHPGTPGWPARPGYDLATGLGTISSTALFGRALAATETRA